MDIQLPGMDGTEAMKKIKENSNRKIPVIAVTAFAMKGDDANYLDQGFDDYVSKPIDVIQLQEKVEKQLENLAD